MLQAKNLVSSQTDSTATQKVTKTTDERSSSSPASKESTSKVNRDQQTNTNATTMSIDSQLINTIHANKGAIDLIRGQITELRHDVDQLRTQIQQRKRSTTINPNPATIIPDQKVKSNLPDIAASPPGPSLNNEAAGQLRKSNGNDSNSSSFSHHHHHHHHVEPAGVTGSSSVCNVL